MLLIVHEQCVAQLPTVKSLVNFIIIYYDIKGLPNTSASTTSLVNTKSIIVLDVFALLVKFLTFCKTPKSLVIFFSLFM